MLLSCLDSYFLEIKKLKTVKKTLKIEIFRQFFYGRKGGVRPKRLKCLWLIWNYYTSFSYISSESLSFQATFLKEKRRRAIKKWSDYNKFGVNISCSVTFFPKAGACFLLKVATKASFGGKGKLWRSRLLGYFSKAKTEEFNQKTWSVCNILDITLRGSAQYYTEMSAHVPQKVAAKRSCKGKNTQKI